MQEFRCRRPFLGCELGREKGDCTLRCLQGHTGDMRKGGCDDPGSSSQGAADTQRQLIVATKERQLWLKIF